MTVGKHGQNSRDQLEFFKFGGMFKVLPFFSFGVFRFKMFLILFCDEQKAFEEGGELYGKNVYLFGCTEGKLFV